MRRAATVVEPTAPTAADRARRQSRRGHRLRAVSRLRPLRTVHGGLPDVCRDGQRKRQPARPHLSDARRDRRPAGADARSAAASGAVPRLPGLRNGLPVGRAIRQADRAVSRGDGADRRRRAQEPRLVSPLDSVSACFPIPSGCARRWRRRGWRSGWGSIALAEALGLLRSAAAAAAATGATCCRRWASREPALPDVLPAIGPRRARVALFTGCVGDAMFRPTQLGHGPRAATKRLRRGRAAQRRPAAGRFIFTPAASEPAREFADANLAAFDVDDVDAVIVNVAGCGAMLKDYGHHWHDARQAERGEVRRQGAGRQRVSRSAGADRAARARFALTATYHDACHLGHAQKIREAPRRLLAKIPGLELVRPARDANSAAARRAPTT